MAKRNPDPVVVGLVFKSREELLVVKRGIEPQIGGIALPGGYIGRGENWRTALQREIDEEACVEVSTDPKHMTIFDVHSTPDGQKLLIFAKIDPGGVVRIRRFKVNPETTQRKFVPLNYYQSPVLCFSLHGLVVTRYRDENFTHEDAHPGGW